MIQGKLDNQVKRLEEKRFSETALIFLAFLTYERWKKNFITKKWPHTSLFQRS
jgi:hypothetical protein